MDVVKREIGVAMITGAAVFPRRSLFRDLSLADEFVPFLTTPAYDLIV